MGCIRSRTPGTFQLLYYYQGKQKSKTIKASHSDARKMLREIERSIDLGTYEDGGKAVVTVGRLLSDWLDSRKGRIAETSFDRYASIIRVRLMPMMGSLDAATLKPADIQNVYKAWEKEGLSGRTVCAYHTVLNAAFKRALRMEVVQRNPADLAEPPAPAGEKRGMALDAKVISRLLDSAAGEESYHLPVLLPLTTGMRVGEICGLRWGDIDFQRSVLKVSRSIAKRSGGGYLVKEPKTKSSVREITLFGRTAQELMSLSGPREAYVIGGGEHPQMPDAVSARVKRFCRNHGVNTTIHGLRHVHASFMMDVGAHPKLVTERMGHANISETLDTYSHTLPSQQAAIAAMGNAALNDKTTT